MPDKRNNKRIKRKSEMVSADVIAGRTYSDIPWLYSNTVKDHFFNPRNFLKEGEKYDADGIGAEGSYACGDVMMVLIKVDEKKWTIKSCRWRTYGCASAIASTSMLSVMITEKGGMKLDRAARIKPQEIIKRLGGLPNRKFHCSVLGHIALQAAIDDYKNKHAEKKL